MTDFTKISSYEAVRDPASGAVLFTGTAGLKQAQVRKAIAKERKKEQDLIRDLAQKVATLQALVS